MDTTNHNELARRPTNALAKRPEPSATLVTPVADIFETADYFTVKLDMPGAQKDLVSVTVEPDYLTAKGEVPSPLSERGTLLLSEIGRKRYFREFNLGQGIDHKGIQAGYDDGVLSITLPKAEALKPRQIEVKVR